MKTAQTIPPSFWRSRWATYLLAVGLTALTLAVRVAIGSRFEGPTMIVFTIPVILSAYWGGIGPGLLSTLLSGLGAAYYILPPIYSFNIASATERWQEVMLFLAGAIISFICETLHRSRRRAEKIIAELNQVEMASTRLAAIVESSTDAIISKDLNSVIITWNKGAEKIFGYTAEEMVGTSIMRLIPADRQDEENLILGKIKRGENLDHFETLRQTKDGRLIHVSVTASPIKDSTGKIVGVSKVARDITERKRAEEARLASETRFKELAENINEVFWMTDPTGHQMLYVSPVFERIWGRTCESLYIAPQSWLEAIHPEDRNRVIQTWLNATHPDNRERVPPAGTVRLPDYEEEYRIVRPDKSIRWIHDRGFAIRNQTGKMLRVVGVARDITEQRKLEGQFRQSQKMEGIGQLAGGVAHDFNNILGVIQMQSDLLKADGNLSQTQLEFANDIAAAAQRAAALTRQLLMFSRKQTLKPCDLDFNASINDMTRMLRRTIGENIHLHFKFAMQPLFVNADAGMMDQVLVNLAVNARDAMPEGGQLVIETSAVDFDESVRAQSAQARPGQFVCLSVSDTGCGIPPENLQKIFEPFFTTKDVGKGTGLGLATVFGIVQQHKGWVNVYSEVNRGTTFRIYLPRLAGMSGQKAEQPRLTAMRGGNETILLVEDDAFLRASVRKALTQLGYHVLEAVNGVEALDVWKHHRDEIHLLLTDLVMPGGINGIELSGQLLETNPKLKVIYASGYSAEVASKDFALEEGVNFLTKPFEAQKLAQTVRNILDKHA